MLAPASPPLRRALAPRLCVHRPGSLPDDVPDSRLKRHVLRLDLSGEVFATFREAMAKIRRDAGESLDDDTAILLLCRQVLEGPKDPGRSSYQIAITVCESCRRATQQGRGELIEVGPEVVEMAECDGQHMESPRRSRRQFQLNPTTMAGFACLS